ncbi:MAG TPA: tripartite tricarboxylate transporter substrate binding protein [Burkholderiaceae bacterium]|nr:tripartite tricarboxylate transporter substrate binding protein [Burkholderiaceae bacterium]
MRRHRWVEMIVLAAALITTASSARAQYPDRPVKVIIPFAPGGGTDIVGRLVAERLSRSTGKPFVAENRPGANAAIGADLVAKSTADGYTLLLGTSAELTMLPKTNPSTPYSPLNDFAPIVLLGLTPNMLLAHPSQPYKDVRELVADAKASPGKLTYASGGMGPYLTGELFKYMAGVSITNVSYQGTGPAHNDLLGGHVPLMVSTLPAAAPLVKSGRVRALAVTSASRSPQLPDVPTMAEQGLTGYEASTWFGLFAPARTPPEVLDYLRAAIDQVLDDKEVQKRFTDSGIEMATADTGRYTLRTRMETDLAKWERLIRETGIKPQ